jgi:hypothetical protein
MGAKPLYIDGVRFETRKLAAKELGISQRVIERLSRDFAQGKPVYVFGHRLTESMDPIRERVKEPTIIIKQKRHGALLPMLCTRRLGVYRGQGV